MVEVKCPCGACLNLGDEWAGKRGKCPKCGAVLQIPLASPPPPEPVRQLPAAAAPVAPAPLSAPASYATAAVAAPPGPPTIAPPPPTAPRARPAAAAPQNVSRLLTSPLAIAAAVGGVSVLLLLVLAIAFLGRESTPEVASADSPPTPEQTASKPVAPPADSVASAAPNVSKPSPPPPPATAKPAQTAPPATTPAPTSAKGSSAPPPTEIVAGGAPAAGKRKAPRGLSGVSNRYSDAECRAIQESFGYRIPPAATMIEVNGEALPVANVADFQHSTAPYLLLPAGEHLVRLRPGDGAVEVKQDRHFAQVQAEMRQFFQRGGKFQESELFSRGAQAMDVHGAPFLLNLMGAAYASQEKWDAAERKFRRALRINPSYSPAHLNLAHCLHRAGKTDEVKRECLLAEAFNIGNVYGLSPAIVKMKRALQLPVDHREPVELAVANYVSLESKSVEDERLEALLLGIAKYATRNEEEGKIRNNLAIHFADTRRPELALEHFRGALAALREAGPDRFKLARQVFSNMHSLCAESRFAEAGEYALMRDTVMPGESP